MKICMYNITTTIKLGGIETYYWEVSKELQDLGHEVEIISGLGDSIKYTHIPRKQFPFKPREVIFNLGNRFRKWGERISFFFNAKSYLKKQNYDVVLIYKPLDFFVCYFMKKYNQNIKTIFVSGGEDFYGFDKFFSKYVDIMIASSNDNKQRVSSRYPNKQIKVIPNGVDINKFKPNLEARDKFRNQFDLIDKKVLISVGRVVGLKGFQLVINALKNLDDNFVYVLIGDGEYLQTLKTLAKDLSVENRVIFLGMIDNEKLPEYLNMGDIYIQPTIGNEAFGITLIEAMACGLPSIASLNGGMVDIIVDSENGYLFEINNVLELISKIDKCVNDYSFMAQKSLETTSQYFTWKSSVESLLNAIKDC